MAQFDLEIESAEGTKHLVQGWSTDDPVKPTLGYGGHPIGSRPKRKALTVYEGRQPFEIKVPMLLWRGGESVEGDRIALDDMATSEGVDENHHPPHVKIRAVFPLPIPPAICGADPKNPATEWWIEDLEWGDELRVRPELGGHLIRKLVTVTLLERIDDELLGDHPTPGGKKWARHYTVKAKHGTRNKPEKLHEIAARELHNAKRWHEIVAHNTPAVRSDGSLHVNMVILLEGTDAKPKPKAKRPAKHH